MIHLNIGSNLKSSHGSRFKNISIAIELLIEAKLKIKKISNYYETPSYPNQKLPKFINIGILANNKVAYGAMIEHYNNLIEGASFATFIENPFDINKQKPIFNFSSQRVCQFTDTSKIDLEDLTTIFTSKNFTSQPA